MAVYNHLDTPFDPPPPYERQAKKLTSTSSQAGDALLRYTSRESPTIHRNCEQPSLVASTNDSENFKPSAGRKTAFRSSITSSGWVYHRKSNCLPYWSRTITHEDKEILQYGCGREHKDQHSCTEPDFFFTCGLIPHDPEVSEKQIRKLCQVVARTAKNHHGFPHVNCSCGFDKLRDPSYACSKSHSWFRFAKWCTAKQTRYFMKKHDRVCSCGCFSVSEMS